ncbi:hypothetical protein ACFXPW_09490 [Streptomyces goshikiensis]|uniref:hypothetical protein n=1 Tax=Streptomyces goshikiensis TaxID=1942 RepID=UPI0036A4C6B3
MPLLVLQDPPRHLRGQRIGGPVPHRLGVRRIPGPLRLPDQRGAVPLTDLELRRGRAKSPRP